ncbi:hypothetical protein FRC04_003053 [Tulasnella sp. 424]|nr:hypothetical protein FRC04_003053 [Tulasnella sp. 424]
MSDEGKGTGTTTAAPTAKTMTIKTGREALREAFSDPQTYLTVSYFESRYLLVTIFMGFLLDRIQNIVAPITRHRNPTHLERDQDRQGDVNNEPVTGPFSALKRIISSFRRTFNKALSYLVPIDFHLSKNRFILRIPTLFLMYRTMWLVIMLMLQSAANSEKDSWVSKWSPLTDWMNDQLAKKDMKDVAWMGFVSVCLTLAVTALNNGLDGSGTVRTSLTFNLVDFGILMHYIGSPVTHSIKPQGLPSRPDIHGLLSMLGPVLDLTIYHTMGIYKPYSHNRLIPSLVSFTTILFSHWLNILVGPDSFFATHNSAMAYFDSMMLVAVSTTWLLKVLTFVLLEGSLDAASLWTMPANMSLRSEDDARTVLLKLIVASFSTTAVSGLSNEMPGLKLNSTQPNNLTEADDDEGEFVAILPDGRVLVSGHNHRHHHSNPNGSSGLGREIKKIKAREPEMSDALFGGWLERGRWRLIAKLVKSIWKLIKVSIYLLVKRTGLGWLLSLLVKGLVVTTGRGASWIEPAETTAVVPPSYQDANQDSRGERDDIDGDYNRFLRGVSITSDGDGDYQPPAEDDYDDAQDGWNFSDDEGEATETEDNREVESSLALIEPSSDVTSTSILLSHLLDTSTSPMTRRRFQSSSLSSTGLAAASSSQFTSPAASQQVRTRKRELDDDEKSTCIVCLDSPRDVVVK